MPHKKGERKGRSDSKKSLLTSKAKGETKCAEVLYYPFIEVSDPGWLLSAALFWDRVVTISPDVQQPYSEDLSRALAEEEILVPHRVNPRCRDVESVSEMIAEMMGNAYFESVIGEDNWCVRQSRRYRVHPDKIASNLRQELERLEQASPADGDYLNVSGGLAAAYILLLAAVIASRQRSALATDQTSAYRAMASYRFSEFLFNDDIGFRHRGGFQRRGEREPAEKFLDACLSELTLAWFRLAPDTDVKKVMRFRRKRRTELVRMRASILKAGSSLIGLSESTYTALRTAAKDYVNSEIRPAFSDLKKTLREERINFTSDSLQLALYSEAPGLIGNQLGHSWALVAAPLCAIAIRAVKYLASKRSMLHHSPLSYLQQAQRKFGAS